MTTGLMITHKYNDDRENISDTNSHYENRDMVVPDNISNTDNDLHNECAPRNLIYNRKDGTILGLVPEGQFLAGSLFVKSGETKPVPITLPAFYLAFHPVTNAKYKRFIYETGHQPPNQTTWGESIWKGDNFPIEKSDHPVVCVNWDDANAYCQWAGLRLPTELEWEKGARGVDGRIFPWGNELDWNKVQGGFKAGEGDTCTVWKYASGRSPWGMYNMVGNVWEWCSDWYDVFVYEHYMQGDTKLPMSGEYRVKRGAAWCINTERDFYCSYRSKSDPEFRFSTLGFRCAMTITK